MKVNGGTVDDLLFFLRRAGFWKVESVRALRELEHMTLPQAKVAVHLSPVWSDRYEADEAFHDQLENKLNGLVEAVKTKARDGRLK